MTISLVIQFTSCEIEVSLVLAQMSKNDGPQSAPALDEATAAMALLDLYASGYQVEAVLQLLLPVNAQLEPSPTM